MLKTLYAYAIIPVGKNDVNNTNWSKRTPRDGSLWGFYSVKVEQTFMLVVLCTYLSSHLQM